MKNVIISSFQRNDLGFSPNVLFYPAVARIVQDHYMYRYQQAWISCINKEFNPNFPNKLKSSHRLAIETGKYTRPITPRSQRFCNHCTQNVLGDEMHFLLSCPKCAAQRKALFGELEAFGNIRNGKDFKKKIYGDELWIWWHLVCSQNLQICHRPFFIALMIAAWLVYPRYWYDYFVNLFYVNRQLLMVVFPVICAIYGPSIIISYCGVFVIHRA